MKTKYLIKKILRKIYHFIGFISLFIIFMIPVKAETGEGQTTINTISLSSGSSAYNWFQSNNNFLCSQGTSCSYSDTFNELYTYYNTNLKNDYPYYVVSIYYGSGSSYNTLEFYYFADNTMSFDYFAYPYIWFQRNTSNYLYFDNSNTGIYHISEHHNNVYAIFGGIRVDNTTYTNYTLYDSNFDIISERDYEIANFYNNNSNLVINIGDKFPKIKDLLDYSSWSDYDNNHLENYTTVDLDDYEYVLLTLKDYNQTQPFDTNLQVKGQIGITPIYNYGQSSKDSITGVRVQDRCNLAYSDFTPYPLYVIQSDLQNNVVYAVKSCVSGSTFKFDNTIFNITYVTQSNLSDPTVTINGQTYHTIPYADLPSSATQNEVENYIPGETGGSGSPGGLAGAIIEAQKQMSSIWNVFTYFTDFVNQIFTALPPTLGNLLKTAFVVAITLGLIKIFIH